MKLDVPDIAGNILGYVPFGVTFASLGRWGSLGVAATVSLFAEISQLFSVGRDPSAIDVATNLLGTSIGLAITSRWMTAWTLRVPEISIGLRSGMVATLLALGNLGLAAMTTPLRVEEMLGRYIRTPRLIWVETNPRGATMPGRLEAQWTFEGTTQDSVIDGSGNGLSGRMINTPTLTPGIDGLSLKLNGVNQYVDLGDPPALRFTGSETIMAWINSSFFPVDDAAVVSDHSGLGFQLDTTVDRGARTIGFKLASASGRLMARYGKTLLALNTWYHIAGVYDAEAQTLDVYLNGRTDNGCLLGTVTNRQHVSGMRAYIGRRADLSGYEFAGLIDNVRIYSRALTQSEVEADFRSTAAAQPIVNLTEPSSESGDTRCPSQEKTLDSRGMGNVATLGVLVAVAILGLLPTVSRRTLCLASFLIGFLLFPTMAATLPVGYKWLLPLLTLAGGASVAFSTMRIKTAPPN